MTSTQRTEDLVDAGRVTEPGERVRRVVGFTRPRCVPIWLAGIFFLCFVFFVPFPTGPNENAHLDLAIAIVNDGTLSIDPYHATTIDLAVHHHHYYINKSPGQSFFAVPVYLVFATLFQTVTVPPPGMISHAYNSYIVLVYVLSILTVSIPAVLVLLLFYWFLGFFTPSTVNRALLTLALGVGTMMFRYAGAVYSHVPAMALLFTAFVLIWMHGKHDAVRGPASAWLIHHPDITAGLAGLCIGGSVLFEISAIPVTTIIGIYALVRLPRYLWPALALGIVPGVAAAGGYNLAAFGNPLVTGYSHTTTAYPGTHRSGSGLGQAYSYRLTSRFLRGRLSAVWGMSFSPFRGVFFLSPFLLLAFPGYRLWAQRGGRDWILFLAIPVCQFFAICFFPGWNGGFAVGPRYLVAMLPFLALPVIFILDFATDWLTRLVVYGLLGLSFFAVWAETLGGQANPPASIGNPLFSYSIPFLTHGFLRSSVVTLFWFLGPIQERVSEVDTSILAAFLFLAIAGFWSLLWWNVGRHGMVTQSEPAELPR